MFTICNYNCVHIWHFLLRNDFISGNKWVIPVANLINILRS